MTTNCELKLQQDNTVMSKVRNLNWNLQNMPPGFVIQLRVNQTVQYQNNPAVRATTRKPDEFLYVDRVQFLSYYGMKQWWADMLAHEGVPLDADGQFLSQSCLRLLLPTSDRPPIFSQSGPIQTLARLTERVLDHARCMSRSQNNRFVRFVPLVMSLTVVTIQQLQFQLQRVDESVILGDQSLETNKSKKVAPVKLVEGIIEAPLTGKNCAICLDDLARGQLAARTPCSHFFHKNCIDPWLITSHSCPLCRADLSKPA